MAAATGRSAPPGSCPVARAAARRIARRAVPWSDPIALLVEAGCASLDGRTSAARTHLRDAADAFDRADMRLYAAVARWRLGQLEGGTLRAESEAWMTAQTIRNPARLTAMLAPGFADA